MRVQSSAICGPSLRYNTQNTIVATINTEYITQEVIRTPSQLEMFYAYGFRMHAQYPEHLRPPYCPQHMLTELAVHQLGLSAVRQLQGWQRVEQEQSSDQQAMVNTMESGKLRSRMRTVSLSGIDFCIMNWKQPVMFFIDRVLSLIIKVSVGIQCSRHQLYRCLSTISVR